MNKVNTKENTLSPQKLTKSGKPRRKRCNHKMALDFMGGGPPYCMVCKRKEKEIGIYPITQTTKIPQKRRKEFSQRDIGGREVPNLEYSTLKELREIANKHSVKYISRMNKKQLYRTLTTKYVYKPKSECGTKSKSVAMASFPSTDTLSVSEIPEYANAEDLKELAKKGGIKYFSRMSKDRLCYEINKRHKGIDVAPTKQMKLKLTDASTGNALKFPSMYEAAKSLGVSASSISNFAGRTDRGVKVKGSMYFVEKI